MEKYRISAIAKDLKLSVTTVYKHLKRLDDRLASHISKENGVTYVSDAGFQTLKDYLNSNQTTAIVTVPANREELSKIDERLAGLEKVILLMADELKASRKEITAVRQENSALRSQMLQLLPPATPAKPVVPWHPAPLKDPLAGRSWFARQLISLFRPWEMRRVNLDNLQES